MAGNTLDLNSIIASPEQAWTNGTAAAEINGINREELQTAINELPDEFKLVLLLFYYEDCSYLEIAERLGLPAGTVMSRLSRAKGHLRARLRNDGQPVNDGHHRSGAIASSAPTANTSRIGANDTETRQGLTSAKGI